MNENTQRAAAAVFIFIGIFLVFYGWPPGYDELLEEEARVVRVVPHKGTRYNVEIVTDGGTVLTCVENTLRQWPPAVIDRCPLEKISAFTGRTVKVWHDGEHAYAIEANGATILAYRVFRNFQFLMTIEALLMIGIGIVVWRRTGSDWTRPTHRTRATRTR